MEDEIIYLLVQTDLKMAKKRLRYARKGGRHFLRTFGNYMTRILGLWQAAVEPLNPRILGFGSQCVNPELLAIQKSFLGNTLYPHNAIDVF